MYPVVVAIDLETTGSDPHKDKIIEIGAIVLTNDQITSRFSELVNPGVCLSPSIIKLTGITDSMLSVSRSISLVLEDFFNFLPPGSLCIAHNASFDRQFLQSASGNRFRHTILDTVELSRICFPSLPSHSLEFLSSYFDLRVTDRSHRALADCEVLIRLWRKLLEKSLSFPYGVLEELNYLLSSNPNHPYSDFFHRVSKKVFSLSFGKTTNFVDLFKNFVSIPPILPKDDFSTILPVDSSLISSWFGPGGNFSKSYDNYEFRSGQSVMSTQVADSFNKGKHLVVEAGTGIGKSLSYLAPAAYFAISNRTPVIISTNTKNLQSQLFTKDIPLLKTALGLDISVSLLRGRSNYLCLRKLFYLLKHSQSELDQEDRMRLLNLLPWSSETVTGDISENIVSGRLGFQSLWRKLCTTGEDCLGKRCHYFKKCFLWRARNHAQGSLLVIANHSLIFSDLTSKYPSLPNYQHIIFDEAHNLEDVATGHLSLELSEHRINLALSRLQRIHKQSRTGLLKSILDTLSSYSSSSSESSFSLVSCCLERCQSLWDNLPNLSTSVSLFFQSLKDLLSSKKSGDHLRFTFLDKSNLGWDLVTERANSLQTFFSTVIDDLNYLSKLFSDLPLNTLPYQLEYQKDLESVGQWLLDISNDLDFIFRADNSDYVYWLEKSGLKNITITCFASPLSICSLLNDHLYESKRSIIFCSATMTVRNSFNFLFSRLGLNYLSSDLLSTLRIPTPFNYSSQCLVLAPTFLPEPGESGGGYDKSLSSLLLSVHKCTEGKGLVLFTSYDMLNKVADILESSLLDSGISLLCQGRSGSRESITSLFSRGKSSVLLGTHSFWEGVDIVGDALCCLSIARLPFSVQTDPLISARCELIERNGGNSFIDFSLPSAVIKFRQGFGRLIRSHSDRGVVIIADRRIISKRYGQWFKDSIPASIEVFSNFDKFLQRLSLFLFNS